jgi:DNA-binding CsgD family transcriptional regulator
MSALTSRQLQVVALLADGLRYGEVGAYLDISEQQVQRHMRNAITAPGSGNSTELVAVAVAVANRLVPRP